MPTRAERRAAEREALKALRQNLRQNPGTPLEKTISNMFTNESNTRMPPNMAAAQNPSSS